MNYLVPQLWLCLLLALLLGGLIGWFLRGGCKSKLAAMSDNWDQRYTLLEGERNQLSLKAQTSNRQLNSERKALLNRLTAMENGANVASSVLKENKDKLDETEKSLAAITLELGLRDTEMKTLKGSAKQSQDLLDVQLSESEKSKLQFEEELLTTNKVVDNLTNELQKSQKESQLNYDQLETLQALLNAHEEGSHALSEETQKLNKALSVAENLNLQQQKESAGLSSRFNIKEKEMQEQSLALNAEIEKLKNSADSSQEELSRVIEQSSSYANNVEKVQSLLNENTKGLASYKLEAETSENKLKEALKLKDSEFLELSEALKIAKQELELKANDNGSLQLLLNEQKTNYQEQSEKELVLVKSLSLADKLNIDYEKKSSEYVSQLALKDEKIKEVEVSLSESQKQLKVIEPQVTEIKSLIEDYETSSKSMLEKLSLLESQVDTYRAELVDAESRLKSTQKLLVNKEKESDDKLSDLTLKLKENKDEIQSIKGDLLGSELKILQSNKNKTECDEALLKLRGRLNSKENEVEDLKSALSHEQERREQDKLKASIKLTDNFASQKKVSAKSVFNSETNTSSEKVKPQHFISPILKNAEIPKQATGYDIEEVEGIGKIYGMQLRKLDISTTDDLLSKSTSSESIDDLARKLNQKSSVVHSWASMSDLLRVEGVDGQSAELLEFSGIHSVQSLAKQMSNPLSKKMFAVNEKEHRVKIAPESKTVAEWIIYATTLTPMLADDFEPVKKETSPSSKVASAKPAVVHHEVMDESNNDKNDYDIEEIDGIGKGYGRRLRAMGIHTTTKLLNKCANTNYEKNIAQAMTLNEKLVKSWCQMADLIRVEGVDGQFADLLFFSGISSVQELSIKDIDKLTSKIKGVNEAQHRVKESPSKAMVSRWVTSAQSLSA